MARRVYFDYCATTPVHPSVRTAMLAALGDAFGNPSSMHWAGLEAARLVELARSQVARSLGCQPGEIYFTAGATEADNLALSGVLRSRLLQRARAAGRAHLITTAIEHHAILHTAQALERDGHPVTYLPVDAYGLVDPEAVRRAIRPDTALISVMLVNNEVGSAQPLAEIGRIARENGVLLHTDAVQGVGLMPVDVSALQVDLLSLSAHKIYGPKGIGALYIREGTPFRPILYGGPQEKGLRPGTENVPGIAGLGAAVQLATESKAAEARRIQSLRAKMIAGLADCLPAVIVNGSPAALSPHILSVSFPGADAEAMLLRLNRAGFAVSMGSACTSKAIEPSHVLTAMGLSRQQIESTLRLSFGVPTVEEEIELFLQVIPAIYAQARDTR